MSFGTFLFLVLTVLFAYLWRKERRRMELIQASRHHLLQERQRVLTFVHDVGESFTEHFKMEEILKSLIRCTVRTAEAKSGAIFLLNSESQLLEAVVIEGPFPPLQPPPDFLKSKLASRAVYLEQAVKSQKIKMGEGLVGAVAASGKPALVKSPAEETRLPHYEDEGLKIETFLAIPLVFREQKLGVLAMANRVREGPFDDSDLSLVTSLANQVAFAMASFNFYQVLSEKERIDRDLTIAREIQQMLLPKRFPAIEGVQVAALNVPAMEVGGDYYGFIPVDANHWGFSIADVSGKGISGALIMTMCRSALRSQAAGKVSPVQVLREVNRSMHPDMREDMFISMVYGILNVATRQFTYCRAGHEPLLLYRQNENQIEPLTPRGMALGIDSGNVFDNVIEEKQMALQKGDMIVLYTDGVTEALDDTDQEFGMDRLIEAIHSCANQTAEETVANIETRVRRFIGQRAQNDDITLVVIRA